MHERHDPTKNATFLPSISNMYVATLANKNITRDIPCLSKTMPVKEHLNHLRKDGVFYYPYALYSAGHAKDYGDECMISKRDPEVFILGDSGGYQIGTGVTKYPWNDPIEQKKVQIETLKWLEKNCQYSMTLDLPPWALLRNKEARKAGFNNFQTCFSGTIGALETFIEHRVPGATSFLNILQGETTDAMDDWYDHVVQYNSVEKYGDRAFEGFAFAGRQSYCFFSILRRLIRMRDDEVFKDGTVLHFLGSGKLNNAAAFSRIQQMLREQTGLDIKITFDAASPYISAASGKVYAGIVIKPDDVTFDYMALPATTQNDAWEYIEGGKMANDPIRLHMPHGRGPVKINIFHEPHLLTNSPVVKDITYKDFYVTKEVKKYEGTGKNRTLVGTDQKIQVDSLAYAVAMAHNVYVHIDGILRMNEIFNNGELGKRLPGKYSKLDNIIKLVFNSKTPLKTLEEKERWLTSFTGRGRRVKAPISTDHTFDLVFSKQVVDGQDNIL